MAKVLWLTDIHVNFIDASHLDQFVDSIAAENADAILIGGDIAEAPSVVSYLRHFAQNWDSQIYFVLGNHDFYHGSIVEVRHQVATLAEEFTNLHFLSTASEPVEIGSRMLIGHDGWADGRVGDYERSIVMMNDYRLIEELREHRKATRLVELQRLGDESAGFLRSRLDQALELSDEVILLTHVPPLREACWHNGQISDDEWAPHFVCLAVGEMILEVMAEHPTKRLTVYCGHTHGEGTCNPLPNVTIQTGLAIYGQPGVTKVLDI
ncbi:MAG: metallophosphoesterase [Planctomycetota bacterium]